MDLLGCGMAVAFNAKREAIQAPSHRSWWLDASATQLVKEGITVRLHCEVAHGQDINHWQVCPLALLGLLLLCSLAFSVPGVDVYAVICEGRLSYLTMFSLLGFATPSVPTLQKQKGNAADEHSPAAGVYPIFRRVSYPHCCKNQALQANHCFEKGSQALASRILLGVLKISSGIASL